MKLIITSLFILLLYGSANAQLKCDAQILNAPGDVIEVWTDWWDQGDNGFNSTLRINGIDWREYGVVPLWEEGSRCLHDCIHVSFTAKTANVYVDIVVTSGNASGWKCREYVQVIGHVEIPPPPQIVTQRKKDQAVRVRNYLNKAFDVLYVPSLSTCTAAIWAPYIFGLPCAALGPAIYFTDRVAKAQEPVILDPWDDNYCVPYDGDWGVAESQRYVEYSNYHNVNNFLYSTQVTLFYFDFIAKTIDRATSSQLAGAGCEGWQIDRLNYGFMMVGAWVYEIAINMYITADQMQQSDWNNGTDSSYFIWHLRDIAANIMGEVGEWQTL